MYCFTCVNGYNCILSELDLWTEISSEHPTFIKTVAALTNKNLSQATVAKLNEIIRLFTELRRSTDELKRLNVSSPEHHEQYVARIRELVNEFLERDRYVLQVLPEVRAYGKEDKVWQTLLEHITHEQNFMFEVFTNIRMQLPA